MLDFNSHDASAWVSGLLDEALEVADAKAVPRAYLGASTLGEACARRSGCGGGAGCSGSSHRAHIEEEAEDEVCPLREQRC